MPVPYSYRNFAISFQLSKSLAHAGLVEPVRSGDAGSTAEDLDAMRVESVKRAAEQETKREAARQAEREAKREAKKSQP